MNTFTYHKFPYSFFEGDCERIIEFYSTNDSLKDILIKPVFFEVIDIPSKLTVLGRRVSVVVLIVSPSNHVAAPHTDGTFALSRDEKGITKSIERRLALNIPVSGCDGSLTRFYTSSDKNPTKITSETYTKYQTEKMKEIMESSLSSGLTDDTPYYAIHRRQYLTKVSELELTSPTLINVGSSVHEVVNFKKTPRVALSLRFDKDPWDWIPGYS
jgi:hypothetical protein